MGKKAAQRNVISRAPIATPQQAPERPWNGPGERIEQPSAAELPSIVAFQERLNREAVPDALVINDWFEEKYKNKSQEEAWALFGATYFPNKFATAIDHDGRSHTRLVPPTVAEAADIIRRLQPRPAASGEASPDKPRERQQRNPRDSHKLILESMFKRKAFDQEHPVSSETIRSDLKLLDSSTVRKANGKLRYDGYIEIGGRGAWLTEKGRIFASQFLKGVNG